MYSHIHNRCHNIYIHIYIHIFTYLFTAQSFQNQGETKRTKKGGGIHEDGIIFAQAVQRCLMWSSNERSPSAARMLTIHYFHHATHNHTLNLISLSPSLLHASASLLMRFNYPRRRERLRAVFFLDLAFCTFSLSLVCTRPVHHVPLTINI